MEANHRANTQDSNHPPAEQTAAVPPTNASADELPGMFYKARNINISGGSFNIGTVHASAPALKVLHKRVAPNAILNAGGRADEVRCYPGTRQEVISRIENWGDAQDDMTPPMFWLSGPAGAGKSAIMQTIAERCKKRKVPHANFFFFRGDPSRSTASPFLATLLHQIILLYPVLRDPVSTLLDANPLIFDSTLEDQLTQLIVTPLLTIQQSAPVKPLMLVIDGLDECDSETKHNQQKILEAFDKVLSEHPCPFRLLIASRDESQIQAAFNRVSSQCRRLYLDDQYRPGEDIRIFVNAQFERVKTTHPLAHTLDARSWPSTNNVNNIVEKSSGQFIYAATVMRFIMDSSASPMVSLERVQGAARLAQGSKSPFAYLDAIYTYILSQVDDQEALKDILHVHSLIFSFSQRRSTPPEIPPARLFQFLDLLRLYNPRYNKAVVLSCLADLTPLALYKYSTLIFHHASFPDYLCKQSQSGNYFIDIPGFSYQILPVVWKCVANKPLDKQWLGFALDGISHLQELPPGLMNTLVSLETVWSYFNLQNSQCLIIFGTIHNLCVRDSDVNNLKRILQRWVNNLPVDDNTLSKIKHIPFCTRYFAMAYAKHHWAQVGEKATALSPETDFDRHESAVWLNSLLRCIHKELCTRNSKHYKQLVKEWISWAVRNDVPCHDLRDLPDAQWCIQMSITKKWAASNFNIGKTKK